VLRRQVLRLQGQPEHARGHGRLHARCNDWTDCDRASAGGYDADERLQFERSVLFSTPFSLGRRRMRLEVEDSPYVENRRWTSGGVTYATLNVVTRAPLRDPKTLAETDGAQTNSLPLPSLLHLARRLASRP
jgi:hypothetical protein